MKQGRVGAISVGANLAESKKAVEIAEQNSEIWCCIGVHPENVNYESGIMNYAEKEFESLIKSPKVVGVGECGLDHFYSRNEKVKKFQKDLFEKQIQFAIKHNKPLMLHIRDAYDDALEILKNYKEARGNVHFFAGDTEIAKKFLDLGFTLSFTGVITFTNDYDEIVKYTPQNSIMSETDAPFIAPVLHRGERNEPTYVIEVVKKLAETRGENLETLNNAILANAKRLFGI